MTEPKHATSETVFAFGAWWRNCVCGWEGDQPHDSAAAAERSRCLYDTNIEQEASYD